ncbi:hypothetical protein GOV11_03425 [Candidatus Woesearchaeota archaeon]|nr:hypothetical protein [Candidatus Woesearchaeota archaeon]
MDQDQYEMFVMNAEVALELPDQNILENSLPGLLQEAEDLLESIDQATAPNEYSEVEKLRSDLKNYNQYVNSKEDITIVGWKADEYQPPVVMTLKELNEDFTARLIAHDDLGTPKDLVFYIDESMKIAMDVANIYYDDSRTVRERLDEIEAREGYLKGKLEFICEKRDSCEKNIRTYRKRINEEVALPSKILDKILAGAEEFKTANFENVAREIQDLNDIASEYARSLEELGQ